MAEHGLAALFTLLVWWGSTGLIIYLDGLRRETFRWTMLGATTLLLAALVGVHALAWQADAAGAWLGFVCGLLCWAWIEVAFLTGLVTGPNRSPCPDGARGWVRLRAALGTILWHELAIMAVAGAIAVLSWGAPNQVALWTFLAFWLMRQSAKLNVYLGVRNLSEAFLPDHLKYLESFFARRRMNVLLPVSVVAGIAACAMLAAAALDPEATRHQAVGFSLLASLVALGLLEHLFMVLPVPADGLWRWSLNARPPREEAPPRSSAAS